MSARSRSTYSPIVTPGTINIGREQLIIVEFAEEIPPNVLITFCLYHRGVKLSTVPAVPLGFHSLKANLPSFTISGEIEGVVHINKEESNLFPHFSLVVMTGFELMFDFFQTAKSSSRIAAFASMLAYLSHCDDNTLEFSALADDILCQSLQQINASELPEWSLGLLLAGRYGLQENLLHLSIRKGLCKTAEHLLLAKVHNKKHEYLAQESSDGRTPLELAQKGNMTRVSQLAQEIMAGSGMKKKSKGKKKKMIEKSRSMDSHINHLCVPGSPDASSSRMPQSPESKKKSKAAKMLIRHFRKDKGMVVSPPQHAFVNEFGESLVAPVSGPSSPTMSVPLSRSMEPISRTIETDSNFTYGRTSPAQPSSPLLAVRRHELPVRTSVTFPRNFRPSSRTESFASSSSSYDHEPSLPRAISPALSRDMEPNSPLSSALKELKAKALYLAEVVREFNWAYGDTSFLLKAGERVFVTQESLDGDKATCLCFWNGRQGKLPVSVLKPLPQAELELARAELAEDDSSDNEYVNIREALLDWREDDVYQVPRNVPYIADSDSGTEDQPVYDVPPRRPSVLEEDSVYDIPPRRPSVEDSVYDIVPNRPGEQEDSVYDIPPSRLQAAQMPSLGFALDDQPVYDVPPTRSEELKAKSGEQYLPGSDSDENPVYDVPPNRTPEPGYQNVMTGRDLGDPYKGSILATTLKMLSSSTISESKPPTASHSRDNKKISVDKASKTDITERKRSQSSPQALTLEQTVHMNGISKLYESETLREEVADQESSASVSETTLPAVVSVSRDSSPGSHYAHISMCHELEQTAQNDDVFVKPSSPTPTPRKRTRIPTAPTVSPKPKPRRSTLPSKSEGETVSENTEHALTVSVDEGKTKALQDKQEEPVVQKFPYVNIEMRLKNRKPPPSPPRKHSQQKNTTSPSHGRKHSQQQDVTSPGHGRKQSQQQDITSPGHGRKAVPPVAPKPMTNKRS